MEKYETVIAGAGPAGLKAAETLAKAGKQVLVLEQKEIIGDKVCAGGLTLKDFELGIPEKIVDRKFKKIILHTPLQDVVIKDKDFFVATIDRKVLGRWMAKQAEKAGAEIRTNTRVSKIGKNYVVAGKNKINFKYLIGADGSNSIVRPFLGLKDKKVGIAMQYKTKKDFRNFEIFFDYDKFGPWYAWIFPHKGYTIIGTGGDPCLIKTTTFRKNLDKWCKGKFDMKKAEFQAHTIRWGYRGHKFGNKFLVGDAAGFASALTGEGMCFAMLSGIDAARKIISPRYKCRNIEHILKVKGIEDRIAMHWEKHKLLTEVEWEIIMLLARSKLVDREIINHLE